MKPLPGANWKTFSEPELTTDQIPSAVVTEPVVQDDPSQIEVWAQLIPPDAPP